MPKEWVIQPPWNGRRELAQRLNVAPVVAQVLYNRGIEDADAASRFMSPRMADLYPPQVLPGAESAARRIAEAIRAGDKIVIYGDYDVDGITGVAILWHCIKLAGGQVDFYVPHRLEEGYGVNEEAIDTLADDGARVIITVDCGVTAIRPAARAKARGIELIITDHHNPHTDESGEVQLPDAMLVHSGLAPAGETSYPNPHLSGAGVAMKLAWAVAQVISGADRVNPEFREFLIDATGLAALGIIADVVPLVGENRIIAYHGLRGLARSKLPGLVALIKSAKLEGKRIDDYDVGFKLAPRLNAIGRMGHARLAVEMLTRAEPDEAERIADNLEKQNRARQNLQRKIAGEARELVIEQNQNSDSVRGIVLASPGWHPGVIGIVASKITEEFGRPTVMIAVENGEGQGSARSIRNFPLHSVFADCREHLLNYGGHAMAAGLRISADQVDSFRSAFQDRAGQLLTSADLKPKLRIDDVVPLEDLSPGLVDDLQRFAPFGAENPGPRLATDWLHVISDPRVVGTRDAHLQVLLGTERSRCRGIAFGMAKHADELRNHRRCRVAFKPILNEWQGRTSVEMQILDFQFPE